MDDGDETCLSSWESAAACMKARAGKAGAGVDWQQPFRFTTSRGCVVELGCPQALLAGPVETVALFQHQADASAGELARDCPLQGRRAWIADDLRRQRALAAEAYIPKSPRTIYERTRATNAFVNQPDLPPPPSEFISHCRQRWKALWGSIADGSITLPAHGADEAEKGATGSPLRALFEAILRAATHCGVVHGERAKISSQDFHLERRPDGCIDGPVPDWKDLSVVADLETCVGRHCALHAGRANKLKDGIGQAVSDMALSVANLRSDNAPILGVVSDCRCLWLLWSKVDGDRLRFSLSSPMLLMPTEADEAPSAGFVALSWQIYLAHRKVDVWAKRH